MRFIDLTGKKFGRLTVIEFSHRPSPGDAHWKCDCDCGRSVVASGKSIRGGQRKSCGCLATENAIRASAKYQRKHGLSQTREYRSWSQMVHRCHNPKNEHYEFYGGRGIVVCERWRGDFETFLADMGKCPSEPGGRRLTIERNEVNGNYEPSNCEWATYRTQFRNKRNNVFITIDGVTKIVQDWAAEKGINHDAIRSRLRKGWDPVRAVTEPLHKPAAR